VRMDSDDIARCHRLERQVAFLEKHPEIGLVGGSIRCFGANNGKVRYWQEHNQIHANCLFNTPFAHPVVCWRRELFIENALWYQEDPPTAEDFELWERACRKVRCANIDSVLIDYRIDPSIKISDYLKQQYRGAREVRERLLRISGIELDEQMMQLLNLMGEGNLPKSKDILPEVSELLSSILSQNLQSGYFDKSALEAVISKWWYSVLLERAAFLSWKEVFSYLKSSDPVRLSHFSDLKVSIAKGKSLLSRNPKQGGSPV